MLHQSTKIFFSSYVIHSNSFVVGSSSDLPLMKKNSQQSFGCLHHVVVLLAEQQADPATEVSGLVQRAAVPLQEAPQALEIPLDVCSAVQACRETTSVNENEHTSTALEMTATWWKNPLLQPEQCTFPF